MYKAKIATNAIRKAIDLTSTLTVPVTIHCEKDKPQVQVMGIRALEQIPGETVYRSLGMIPGRGQEASREYDGVKFYCLLTQRQYERLQRLE